MQYVVQPGDSPTRIAGNVWGNQRYYQLVPGNLHPGQVLDLPDDPGADPVITQQQWAAAPTGYSGGQAQYGNTGGGVPAPAKPTGPKVPAIGQVPVPNVGNPGQQWGIPTAPAKPATNVKLPGAPQTGPGGAGTFANTATKPLANYSYGGGTSVGKIAMPTTPAGSNQYLGLAGPAGYGPTATSLVGPKPGGLPNPGRIQPNAGGFTTGQLYQGQTGQTGAGPKPFVGSGKPPGKTNEWGSALTPETYGVMDKAALWESAQAAYRGMLGYTQSNDRNDLPLRVGPRVAAIMPWLRSGFGSPEEFMQALGYRVDPDGQWVRYDPTTGKSYGSSSYSGGGGYDSYGYGGFGGYDSGIGYARGPQSTPGYGLVQWRIG